MMPFYGFFFSYNKQAEEKKEEKEGAPDR
ncbi:hypothetical protein NC651_013626 [Populus alba x Populus x berolinensis]|nr:hypothetical protein NC651_013626 [Populus alba x Populus x berolinensis]